MRTISFVLATVLATVVGCAGPSHVGIGATYGSDYYYDDPYLSYVSPGVYAVTNWRYPVFYSDNYYWRYDSGLWYRSPYYTGGWHRARPPRAVLRIDRPSRYSYYRPTPRRTHVDVREERAFRDRNRFEYRYRDGQRIVVPRDGRSYNRQRYDRGYRRSRPYVIDRS